ncbi:LOW QUALITY PROTEIN: hypothetical protein TorRG33x02_349720 [Trema orientale]|uniref:Uncharacterized protein n=1 Tax=Trema orientale TaxID=63057 RepID=A0A2P5AI51_TREOI|nr:LOW QUALITY PROTEIN: hypothetical protein TorRG33x02_349720 [Trema orientale]
MLESTTALTFSIVRGLRAPWHFVCSTMMLRSKIREHRGAPKAVPRHYPFCLNDGFFSQSEGTEAL